MTEADFSGLDEAGLNLQAVFNIVDLPPDLANEIGNRFDPEQRFRQLILIGHGGRRLWECVKKSGIGGENPIDDFSRTRLQSFLADIPHIIIYPATSSIGLQSLGKLAGWHHSSPFMVGINASWGTWYAYRAVALSASDFAPTSRQTSRSPCANCADRCCVSACPADALSGKTFDLQRCISYRKQPTSLCRDTCLARCHCPVGEEHRYDDEQIRHAYSISMRMIEQFY